MLDLACAYGKPVENFVEWSIGATYELDDLVNVLEEMIPPVVSIIYSYLSPPHAALVKKELFVVGSIKMKIINFNIAPNHPYQDKV